MCFAKVGDGAPQHREIQTGRTGVVNQGAGLLRGIDSVRKDARRLPGGENATEPRREACGKAAPQGTMTITEKAFLKTRLNFGH